MKPTETLACDVCETTSATVRHVESALYNANLCTARAALAKAEVAR